MYLRMTYAISVRDYVLVNTIFYVLKNKNILSIDIYLYLSNFYIKINNDITIIVNAYWRLDFVFKVLFLIYQN